MIERFGTHGTGPGGNPLPFAKAVRAGDFVFVSGQVGAGPDGEIVAGGIVAQTTRCIENIKATTMSSKPPCGSTICAISGA